MRRHLARGLLVALTLAAGPARALTEVKVHPPLTPLPADQLATLAPLLRTGDFAVLESDARGREKQITTITLSRAAPEAVREVVIHPERYEDFVRNMVGRQVKKNADGTFDHTWKLSYTVASFSGVNRYRLIPAREGEAAGPVEIKDPTGMSTYRWEFLPALHGGGTIVVLYGYTDVRHSGGFIDKVLAAADTLEHGLSLITQMSLHRAMTEEAEKRPGTFPPFAPPKAGSKATSYKFLLDRGVLAILRRAQGRLAEFSLIDRTIAPAAALLDELAHPERWRYVPSLKVTGHDPRDGLAVVELEQSVPLMKWSTHFGVRSAGSAVDMLALEGDLTGGMMRFDLHPDGTLHQLILRARLAYDRSNVVMRTLFKREPLFEDGVDVGLTYVILRAIRAEVERRGMEAGMMKRP